MKKLLLLFYCITLLPAEKSIVIDLTSQTLTAKDGDTIALKSPVCTGRIGHTTPIGKFKILEKNKLHVSNRYPIVDKEADIRGGAKMPYMLRVTNGGIAIHAGEMVNYPDSHGCIRIPYGKAMQLFKWTNIGTKVKIVGETPYDDPINEMRMSLLKNKKETHSKDNHYNSDIKWVDDSLSYYDNL